MTLRMVARVLVMAVLLVAYLPIYAIFRLFGAQMTIVSRYLSWVSWLLGVRITVRGVPVRGNALYVANHISWLDIPALCGAVPARFIAKSEIAGWSLIGWLAKLGGSVFVRRQNRSETRMQANAVAVALGEGVPVVLFPEAGTGDGIALSPFRPSLFISANEARVTVQPVVLDYGARQAEIAWPDGAGFVSEMKRMLNRPAPVPLTLHFLPPLDGAVVDRKQLAAQTYAAITKVLEQA